MIPDHVSPAEIVRQRSLNWPDFHPERYCHLCGRLNIWSWSVDAALWEQVTWDLPVSILCPVCFAEEAARKGIWDGTWVLMPDPTEKIDAPHP
jgi:hypothetical protein